MIFLDFNRKLSFSKKGPKNMAWQPKSKQTKIWLPDISCIFLTQIPNLNQFRQGEVWWKFGYKGFFYHQTDQNIALIELVLGADFWHILSNWNQCVAAACYAIYSTATLTCSPCGQWSFWAQFSNKFKPAELVYSSLM